MSRLKSLKKLCMYKIVKSTIPLIGLTEDLKEEVNKKIKQLFRLEPGELVNKCAYNYNLALVIINDPYLYGKLVASKPSAGLSWIVGGFFSIKEQNDIKLKSGGYLFDFFCYHPRLYAKCKNEKHELVDRLSQQQIKSLDQQVQHSNAAVAWLNRHGN